MRVHNIARSLVSPFFPVSPSLLAILRKRFKREIADIFTNTAANLHIVIQTANRRVSKEQMTSMNLHGCTVY
jgi:hypothetical protein